jgi:site-specific DNA-cytosine methylase
VTISISDWMLFVVMISLQLTYLEFYSGIGGWGYALEHALRNIAAAAVAPQPHLHLTCRLLGAFDHSDLCKSVFSHNHNQDNKKLVRQTPIERITQQELEALAAQIWCMSPVSRRHNNDMMTICSQD